MTLFFYHPVASTKISKAVFAKEHFESHTMYSKKIQHRIEGLRRSRDRDDNAIDTACHKILYKRPYELTQEIKRTDKTVNRIHQVALASAQFNRLRKVYHTSQQT